ncbi:MAG: hypothetical protein M9913_11320 [Bryobacteraceae bacterium]|nr:hypothetical protein [Bryobacteraceae bacterium]
MNVWLPLLLLSGVALAEVRITTGVYEEAEHFVVRTAGAEYWYDRAGGGFSRILDRDGRDWVGFRRDPWNEYPASAGSSYRGLPNFVFGPESGEAGAGHPGFRECRSVVEGGDSIVTESRSGAWRWRWRFFDDHARVMVEKVGAGGYWFLYEGVPGGGYAPGRWYWGHDGGGPLREMPDFVRGDRALGRFQWAYFGSLDAPRVFFVARTESDEAPDSFGVMGSTRAGLESPDGMVVFGFGRGKAATPLLRGAGRAFVIGFREGKVGSAAEHGVLEAWIAGLAGRGGR